MSQLTTSSSTSASSSFPFPLDFQSHVLACCWGWCRFSTSTKTELIEHVIQEHARKATPVRRRDIPMLRRAEEGIGESFGSSLRKLMDGNLETIYYRALNSGDATDQDLTNSPGSASSRPPHAWSPSSSPRGSPYPRGIIKRAQAGPSASHTSNSLPQSETNSERLRAATPPRSVRGSLPPHDHSRLQGFHSSSPSPGIPGIPFASFPALSSQSIVPCSVPSVPASPSSCSQVANTCYVVDHELGLPTINATDNPAKRRKIEVPAERERSPYHLSQKSHSQSSSESCDLVEQQLTQSLDMDVGVHGAVIRDRDGHRGTTGRDPNSISKEGESVFAPNTPTKAELDPSMQLSPQSPSASQRQVEFRPQQTRSTVLTSSLGQRNARRQAWYQLSPHMRKHSQSAVLNESGASFPASQTLLPQYSPLDARANISHSESHLLSGSASPSDLLIRSQSQGHVPVSGPIFRSGTLQIGPAMNAASQQAVAREGQILEDGIKDDVMDICHSPSLAQARGRSNSRIETRSQLSQYQSQSLSSTGDSSFESHSSPFEYQFLTQAPCQSQSLSQS